MKIRTSAAAAFLAVLVVSGNLMAGEAPKASVPDAFKKGKVLVYNVTNFDKKYDFILTLTDRDAGLAFSWKMTEPVNKEGTIEVKPEALASATTLYNFFGPGPVSLDAATCVWVSKGLYQSLKKGETVLIDAGQGDDEIKLNGTETFKTTVDGKAVDLPVLHATTTQGYEFWIVDSEKDPIIVKMQLGFEIQLKEVK